MTGLRDGPLAPLSSSGFEPEPPQASASSGNRKLSPWGVKTGRHTGQACARLRAVEEMWRDPSWLAEAMGWVDSRLADAVRVGTLRVAAHRRLFALDPATRRWPYDRAVEDLIAVSSAAGDQPTLQTALTELIGLLGSLRNDN